MKSMAFCVRVSAMSSSFHRAACAAAHVADAADAVDDGLVVAVAGLHLEQFRMVVPGRLVADLGSRS